MCIYITSRFSLVYICWNVDWTGHYTSQYEISSITKSKTTVRYDILDGVIYRLYISDILYILYDIVYDPRVYPCSLKHFKIAKVWILPGCSSKEMRIKIWYTCLDIKMNRITFRKQDGSWRSWYRRMLGSEKQILCVFGHLQNLN